MFTNQCVCNCIYRQTFSTMASKTMIKLSRMSKIFQPMATELSDIGDKTEISRSHKVCPLFPTLNIN